MFIGIISDRSCMYSVKNTVFIQVRSALMQSVCVNTDTHNLAKCLDCNNGVMHFLFGVEGTGIASLSFAISSNYLSLCKKY